MVETNLVCGSFGGRGAVRGGGGAGGIGGQGGKRQGAGERGRETGGVGQGDLTSHVSIFGATYVAR